MVEIAVGHGDVNEPTVGSTEAAPGSIIRQLRVAAQAQQQEMIKDFPVGGEFKSVLQIRYKPLRPEVMDDFVAKQLRSDIGAIELNMDLMARACVAVVGCDPSTGEKEILSDERGAILLEHRLAVLLDFPIPPGATLTSHEVINMLFGFNGMAIGAHGDMVSEWMRNPGGENLGEG
jgi:hypothetical protein